MPNIVPRQSINIPTGVAPPPAMAIATGLKGVAGIAAQVEKGNRQEDEFALKLAENREKNAANQAYLEKNKARQLYENEIINTKNPEEYIDALHQWEKDYDNDVLAGQSQVFSDNFTTYDRLARFNALRSMGTMMQTAIFDEEVSTVNNDFRSASTIEEAQAALARALDRGIMKKSVVEEQYHRRAKDIAESQLVAADPADAIAAINAGAYDEQLDGMDKANLIDRLQNKARRQEVEALNQEIKDINVVGETLTDMAKGGASVDELHQFVKDNTDQGTFARNLAESTLRGMGFGGIETEYEINQRMLNERRQQDAIAQLEDMDRRNAMTEVDDLITEMAIDGEPFEVALPIYQNMNVSDASRTQVRQAFLREYNVDPQKYINAIETNNKSQIRAMLKSEFSHNTSSTLSRMEAYIDGAEIVTASELKPYMNGLASNDYAIREALQKGDITEADGQKLIYDNQMAFIKAHELSAGRNPEVVTTNIPYHHLQGQIQSVQNNLSISTEVKAEYMRLIVSDTGTPIMKEQTDSIRATNIAIATHNEALKQAYMGVEGISENDAQAKINGANKSIQGLSMNLAKSSIPDSLTTPQQVKEFLRNEGYGLTAQQENKVVLAHFNEGGGNPLNEFFSELTDVIAPLLPTAPITETDWDKVGDMAGSAIESERNRLRTMMHFPTDDK